MAWSMEEKGIMQDTPSVMKLSKVRFRIRTSEEDMDLNTCMNPKPDWVCPLCQVSATSEQALYLHLQGKEHQSKKSKLNIYNNNNQNSLKHMKFTDNSTPDHEQSLASEKLYCHLCRVSVTSEQHLTYHFQGKKHKAKELSLLSDLSSSNMDDRSTVKSQEYVNPDLQGKKHNAKEAICLTGSKRDKEGESVEAKRQKESTETDPETNNMMCSGLGKVPMEKPNVKYWQCQMCDFLTERGTSMDAHRKGKKHIDMLRRNRGTVIIVGRLPMDARCRNDGKKMQ